MSPVAPYRVPQGTSNPFDSLQNEMNTYASRGFPGGVTLSDAYPDRGVAVSGVTWGGNTTSYVPNVISLSATTVVTVLSGGMYALPFVHGVGFGLSTLGLRRTASVAAGAPVGLLGVYDSTEDGFGNPYPRRLLWGSAVLDVSAINTTTEVTPNLSIAPGKVYWVVGNFGSNSCEVVGVPTASTGTFLGYSTGSGAPTLQTYLYGTYTFANVLPTLYPSGHTPVATIPPLFYFKYNPSQMQTFTQSFPIWSPSESDYAVRGVRLLGGQADVKTGSGRPSVKVKARIVNRSGATVLGTFDSSKDVLKPGVPFYLTDIKNDATPLPKDSVLEAYVEQTGWPLASVEGCRVCCDIVRTRP